MKKLMLFAAIAIAAVTAFARPHHGGGFRPGPMHHGGGYRYHGGHHHHGSWWGRGGRNFWPAFAGGMVGGYCYGGTTVVTAPAVVPTTTVVPATTVVAPVQPVSAQPYRYIPLDTRVRVQ